MPETIKKETLAQAFSCEFSEILRNTSGRLLLEATELPSHSEGNYFSNQRPRKMNPTLHLTLLDHVG